MIKKLCMKCRDKTAQTANVRYTGKKNYKDICERCWELKYVTEYDVNKTEDKRTSEKTERIDISLNVNANTARNIKRLAERWQCSEGAVVDSVLVRFLRNRKGGNDE